MRELARKSLFLFLMTALAVFMVQGFQVKSALAIDVDSDTSSSKPPEREELENIPGSTMKKQKKENDDDSAVGLPFDIRNDSMRAAALSYGARGGLAWRTYYIRQELETRADYLDKVFNFNQLLIPAPSGLLIEPPIVSESVNSLIVANGGQEAAVSDRIYEINRNARIITAARHWRNYLERDWGEVLPPPDILRPSDEEERKNWILWIREGWDRGLEQAEDIFQDDLQQLTAHYQGMVRYRVLLAQGMVTPPYAMQVDRGVTGGGNTMRVGDRAVQITGVPELMPGSESWQPASR